MNLIYAGIPLMRTVSSKKHLFNLISYDSIYVRTRVVIQIKIIRGTILYSLRMNKIFKPFLTINRII